jgi:hypothetical protein
MNGAARFLPWLRHDRPSAKLAASFVALALLVVLPACGRELPSYHYRLTVEVETPEGLRTGSSVIEVRTFRASEFPGAEAGGVSSRIRGEAVAVDLGARGILFVLLQGRNSPTQIGGLAMPALLPRRPDPRGTAEALGNNITVLKRVRGAAPVPSQDYPTLMRFGDIRNPASAIEVDPTNLAASFGTGVRLRRMTAEITEDNVTSEIEERLPWWDSYHDRRLDGSTTRIEHSENPNLAHHLGQGSFSTGLR